MKPEKENGCEGGKRFSYCFAPGEAGEAVARTEAKCIVVVKIRHYYTTDLSEVHE